jgi:hypothetical protein
VEYHGVFEAEREYKASIELTAASGYTFDNLGEHFTHATAQSVSHSFGFSSLVSIIFKPTAPIPLVSVGDLDLTDKVSRPAAGVMPEGKVFGTQYTGTVDWTVTAGSPVDDDDPFAAGTFYTATVTLNAAPGYIFTGIKAKPTEALVAGAFTYSGGTVTHPEVASPGAPAITVTIKFPVTAGPATVSPQRFGNIDSSISALYHMNQRKDGGPLTINILNGITQTLVQGTSLITREAGQENTPRHVTINGTGSDAKLVLKLETSTSPGPGITLRGDGTDNGLVVTLTNIVIQGRSGLNAPLVKLEDKARLVLGSGVIIGAVSGLGNDNSAANGGGVHLGPGCVLEMEDGSEIKGNTYKETTREGACTMRAGPSR